MTQNVNTPSNFIVFDPNKQMHSSWDETSRYNYFQSVTQKLLNSTSVKSLQLNFKPDSVDFKGGNKRIILSAKGKAHIIDTAAINASPELTKIHEEAMLIVSGQAMPGYSLPSEKKPPSTTSWWDTLNPLKWLPNRSTTKPDSYLPPKPAFDDFTRGRGGSIHDSLTHNGPYIGDPIARRSSTSKSSASSDADVIEMASFHSKDSSSRRPDIIEVPSSDVSGSHRSSPPSLDYTHSSAILGNHSDTNSVQSVFLESDSLSSAQNISAALAPASDVISAHLQAENTRLKAQLQREIAARGDLQRQLREVTDRNDSLVNDLKTTKEQLVQVKEERDHLSRLLDTANDLTNQLSTEKQELENKRGALLREKEDLEKSLNKLQSELYSSKKLEQAHIKNTERLTSRLRDLTKQLEELNKDNTLEKLEELELLKPQLEALQNSLKHTREIENELRVELAKIDNKQNEANLALIKAQGKSQSLEKQVTELGNKNRALDIHNLQLQGNVGRLNSLLKTIQDKLSRALQLNSDNANNEARARELEQELFTVQADLAEKTNNLEAQIEKAKVAYDHDIAEKSAEISSLNDKLSSLTQSSQAAITELNDKLADAQRAKDALETKSANLSSQLGNLRTDSKILKDSQDSGKISLNRKLKEAQSSLEAAREKSNRLNTQLVTERETFRSQKSPLENAIRQLEAELTQEKDKGHNVAQKEFEIAELKRQLANQERAHEASISKMQTQLSRAHEENNTLQANVQKLTAQKTQTENALLAAKQQVGALTDRTTEQETQLSSLTRNSQAAITELNDKLADAQRAKAALEDKSDNLSSQLGTLKTELRTSNDIYERAKTSLNRKLEAAQASKKRAELAKIAKGKQLATERIEFRTQKDQLSSRIRQLEAELTQEKDKGHNVAQKESEITQLKRQLASQERAHLATEDQLEKEQRRRVRDLSDRTAIYEEVASNFRELHDNQLREQRATIEQIRKTIEKIQAIEKTNDSKLANTSDSVSTLEHKIEELENKITELRRSINTPSDNPNIKRLQDQASALNTEIEALRAKSTITEQERARLESQLQQAQQESLNSRQAVLRLESQISELENEKQEAIRIAREEATQESNDKYARDFSALNTALSDSEETKEERYQAIIALEKEKTELASQLQQAQQDQQAITDLVGNRQALLEQKEARVRELEDTINLNNATIEANKEEIAGLESSKSSLNERLSALDLKYSALIKEIETIRAKNTELTSKNTNLESQLAERERELLNASIGTRETNDYKQAIAELQATYRGKFKDIERTYIEALENEKAQLQSNHREELEALKTQLQTRFRKDLETLEKQFVDLIEGKTQQIEALNHKVNEIKARLANQDTEPSEGSSTSEASLFSRLYRSNSLGTERDYSPIRHQRSSTMTDGLHAPEAAPRNRDPSPGSRPLSRKSSFFSHE